MTEAVNITAGNARLCRLQDLVSLRAGYSFRSAILEVAEGNALAVQLRDIQQEKLNWHGAVRTHLARSPSEDEWLRPGDILFAFRGTRYFAVLIEEVPAPAVASTQFMLLRVRDPGELLPEFLAWQLNQSPVQTYFDAAADGTAQKSLRRAVLELAEVAVPSIPFQRAVATLAAWSRREREILDESIRNRQRHLDGIAVTLMQSARDDGST
jgi:hypothetical protein